MKRLAGLLSAAATALVLTACAAPGGGQPGAVEIQTGVIEQITRSRFRPTIIRV